MDLYSGATFLRRVHLGRTFQERRSFLIDVQYTNDEGDQRAVTRFIAAPTDDDGTQWLCSVGRHVYLDRPNPR